MANEDGQNEDVRRPIGFTVVVDQEHLAHNHARTFRSIIWKLDKRLIPFLFLLEFSSYINRISIGTFYLLLFRPARFHLFELGNVKSNGLEKDLNLSKSDDNWTISLFFLALVSKQHSFQLSALLFFFQLIFDIPSILLLRIIGPTRYLSWSMIAWGSITIGMAFVKNARELLALRFLLVRILLNLIS
jgi:hypothetical protein